MTSTETTQTQTTAKKALAKKAPATPALVKLRWQYDKDTKMETGQTAVVGDRSYAVKPGPDGTWRGTVQVGKGKVQVLSDTTFAKAYNSCVRHNKDAQNA
jgi:hypothetical protein